MSWFQPATHDATSNHDEVDHVDLWSEAQYLWNVLVEYPTKVQIVATHAQDDVSQQFQKILVATSFAKYLDQLNKSLVVMLIHRLCKATTIPIIFKS